MLPNGPEMATAFVSVAAAATTAPLNPAYRAEELDFYLSDIAAKALIVLAGRRRPGRRGRRTARHRRPAARSPSRTARPARSRIEGDRQRQRRRGPASPRPDDIALLLHTSGTTSRPKLVPLSHANLAASAAHIGETLALTPDDRCLNIMPLFHIHGLIAAVLSSLAAGASVFCTPGFNALRFFAWLEEAKPTWYTAVPTMHQAILARAARNAEAVAASRLRFIRSSSASLPPQVMAELEATFGCPVIESYGMTEAAHQMASNPLPPRRAEARQRRPGRRPGGRHHGRGRRPARPPTPRARSSSAARTSPPATRTIPKPTAPPSPMAGSAPATRACSTPTAMSASPAA